MEKNPNKSKLKMPALLRKDGGAVAGEMRQPWNGLTVVKKVLLIVLALVLATLLWGYVLLAQNPDRPKEFTGIEVKLESGSEADLLYKNLMVYGGVAKVLREVSVTVKAPLADITKISAKDIAATVSFNDVHNSGPARLEIKATCSNGTVVAIDPAYIEVDIDDIVSRTLSVDQEIVGELPEGYWHGSVTITPKSVTVKGPRRDVERISGAVCDVDLTGLTESLNRSVGLVFTDDEGNVFDQSGLVESIPSVSVSMQVLPYRELDIFYTYADELPAGLEITEESLDTPTVRLACESNVLSKLEGISAGTVRIGNITAPGIYDYTLQLTGIPDDAVFIDYSRLSSVKLTIVVAETRTEREFEDVNITVTGKSDQYTYTFSFYNEDGGLGDPVIRLAANVKAIGVGSILQALSAQDFMLLLDVTGLGAGSFDRQLRLVWNDAFTGLESVEFPATVHVVIEPAAP